MRRTMAALLCALFLLASLAGAALAAAAEEEEDTTENEVLIDRYDAACIVDEHGVAEMTVTVDMTISKPMTELEFPIGEGGDGEIAGMDIDREETEDGTSLLLTSETGISGKRTFVITYTLGRVVSETEEGQELALALVARGWKWPMTEAAFTVTMPAAFTAEPVYLGGYYDDIVEDYMELEQDSASFSGAFIEPLRDHDSLTVTLELPAEYVDLRSADGISPVTALLLTLLPALLCLVYWYRFLYNGPLHIRPRPMPPDGAGAGDLPAICYGDAPSLPLQVMSWASLGYLTVHLVGGGRVVLRRVMPMGSERRRTERDVFSQLFDRGGLCEGEGARFGSLAARYAASMDSRWRRRLFSRASGSPALLRVLASLSMAAAVLGAASKGLPISSLRGLWLALSFAAGLAVGLLLQTCIFSVVRKDYRAAALRALPPAAALVLSFCWDSALTVTAAVVQCFAAWATLRGGRRNPTGRDLLAQTLGLRRFLRHADRKELKSRLRRDGQYVYRMLPYAEALGLGKELADRLGGARLEPCDWLMGRRRPASAAEFYHAFREALARMERAVR